MVKATTRAILWVCLIFLAGSLFGALASTLWRRPPMIRPPWTVRDARSLAPELRRLMLHLELDQAQRGQVSRILEEARERFQNANERHRQEMASIRAETLGRIRRILRPDQERRLEEFLRRYRQRERRFGTPP